MILGKPYRFEDMQHFKGCVMADEISISILELELVRIRAIFEIIKKQNKTVTDIGDVK